MKPIIIQKVKQFDKKKIASNQIVIKIILVALNIYYWITDQSILIIIKYNKECKSTSLMQRMLNKDYGLNVTDITFLYDFKMQQLSKFINITSQLCEKCRINKKTHYCMEPICQERQLICWNCDPQDIKGKHFLHQYAYCPPLFCKNIHENFTEIKQNLILFHKHLNGEIQKISDYLNNLKEISSKAQKKIAGLEEQIQASLFFVFEQKVKDYKEYCDKKVEESRKKDERQQKYKLKDFLQQVKFYSAQQCMKKQEDIIKDLMESISELKWLKNPEKQLKQILQVRGDELKKDIFLGSHKKIQFTEIDHFFKINNQFLTENMRTHKVQLKVQSDFLNKTKFYEALVYHLKDTRRLSIENAHINQIRTPLTFKHLQQFDFACNTETQPFNLRIQTVGEQLESLTIRKLREEQIKILKTIVQNTKQLKKLHLQFYNKCDLTASRDMNQFFVAFNQNGDNLLFDLCLKIRTESQVKRMYGYLSKFQRDLSIDQNSPIVTIWTIPMGLKDLLSKNKRNVQKLTIEGIKNLMSEQMFDILLDMRFLIFLKLKYDNVDLLIEFNEEKGRKLLETISEKNRTLHILAKYEMEKSISLKTMNQVYDQFLF